MRGKSGYTYRTYQDFGAKNASFYASDKSHYGNDVPFEVPEGWVWCRLKDITELIEDCPHSTAPDEGHGYPLIRTPNVGEGHLVLNGVHRVSQKVYETRTTRATPKCGDIIYAREAPAGNAAVIAENETVCLGQRTVLIRPLGAYVNPMLLTYFLLSPYSRNSLISKATGSTVQHVNMETIRPLYVPIPPFNEQIRIVAEIDRYFALVNAIEQNESSLKDAVQKAKSKILDLALSGRLTSDTSHYRKWPAGWEKVRLGNICRLISGTSYSKNDIKPEGIRILRGGNIQCGKVLLLDNDVYVSTALRNKECALMKGDIAIVASTGSLDLIGKAGYVEQDIPDTQIGAFLRIVRPIDPSVSQYLRLIFESNLYKSHIQDLAKGTNINNIKASYITNFFIPLPPTCEQKTICNMVKVIFQQLDDIESSIVK